MSILETIIINIQFIHQCRWRNWLRYYSSPSLLKSNQNLEENLPFQQYFRSFRLIIGHISDHLDLKLSNLLSKRGSQTNQSSQHCDSEKLEEFLSPRWNAKRFHSAQVLISITENDKIQARCWISWWGDRTEILSVLRFELKAGIGCYVTLLFLGDICLHHTFVTSLTELPKQINLPCYFELKWHVIKLEQLHNWHRTE